MAHQGKQIARALVAGDHGHAEQPSGWRGALQVAADLTRNDRDVLWIADDVYVASRDLRTAAAIRAYALSSLSLTTDGPGHWLLCGMLEAAEAMDS